MLRCILFDLYGTLVEIETNEGDERTTIAFAASMAARFGDDVEKRELSSPLFKKMQKMGVGLPDEKEPNLRPLLEDHLAYLLNRTPSEWELRECGVAFRAASRRQLALYPGTLAALLELKNRFAVGLVSNAQELFTRSELQLLELEGLFYPELLSSEVGFRKPSKEIFQKALELADVKANEALYVGNDPFADIDGAAALGMYTCRVRDPIFEGLYSKSPPSLHVERVSELPLLLCGQEVPKWVTGD